jgi:signal transduction histidine kinase
MDHTAEAIVKLLLVDDNENNLLSMQAVLEDPGYQIFQATSGSEALQLLLIEGDFCIILLDVQMPVMDGYETAARINQIEGIRSIPIIFVTAYNYEEDAIFKGYSAGAVDFIRKPFAPEILRSKVAVFAELHRKTLLLKQQEERLQVINGELVLLNLDLERRVAERTAELENANKELKELNLSKDKFLSVISHDLRNPLTSLLLSSENLTANADHLESGSIKKLASIINRTSNKILEQLNELVDWARKQREKTEFNPERIHLVQGVSESLELLKPSAHHKSIRFAHDIPQDLYIQADPLMLRSILQNIVTNAIKYTPHGGGVVNVSASQANAMVSISVQDFGVGMSKKVKDMISGDSVALSHPGTEHEIGTGLGLLLVKDFVAQHGGTIHIDSEVGKGTHFKFTMPISN